MTNNSYQKEVDKLIYNIGWEGFNYQNVPLVTFIQYENDDKSTSTFK